MKIETIPQDGYEHVAKCEDPESGLRAVISIHDTSLGPALGGLRMWKYASWDEAVFDVLRLSKGMTFKSAVADTGLGGGKSVIIGDPKTGKSEKLFRAMGRFVDSMGGRYITAEDVGTCVEDMVQVRMETKYVTGLPRSMGSSGDPSPWTALGVYRGIKACMEEVFDTRDLTDRTVAIQGCGHVGHYLAQHLANLYTSWGRPEAASRLYLADIAAERASAVAEEVGGTVVDPAEILRLECDIFALVFSQLLD